MSTQRTITLVEDADGWTAIDEDEGLECRGDERAAVLDRLDDAAAISFEDEPRDDDSRDDGAGDEPALLPDDDAIDWFEDTRP